MTLSHRSLFKVSIELSPLEHIFPYKVYTTNTHSSNLVEFIWLKGM